MTAPAAENTERNYYYARRACPRCNAVYTAGIKTQPEDVCPACKKALAAEEKQSRPRGVRQEKGGRAPQYWVVVNSADPDFQPGVKFQTLDFMCSLAAHVWPAGMVVECERRRYTVLDGGGLQDDRGNVHYYHTAAQRGATC